MQISLGLGANLGDRLRNLQTGLRLLAPFAVVSAASSLYESEPVGPSGQPPYFNAAVQVTTDLTPHGLLDWLKRVEWLLGRRPSPRWGPRPLDLDILLAGNLTLADARLSIPHRSLAERAFVLTPLAEIAGDASVPPTDTSVADLAARAGDAGLVRRAGPEWIGLSYL